MYAKLSRFTILALAALLAGCTGDLLETRPTDSLNDAIFWESQRDAINAVNALYPFLPSTGELQWDMMSDIGHTNNTAGQTANVERGTHSPDMPLIGSSWNGAYQGIRAANYFLENLPRVQEGDPSVSDELASRLGAEARFIRAFLYTRLTMLYGDVPLVTTTLTLDESKQVSRAPTDEVWDFITTELAEIAPHLPLSYGSGEVGRITRGAAHAMRARANLYAGRWQEAAEAARTVMEMGVYSLHPSYAELFGYDAQNSSEVILDRQHARDIAAHGFFQGYAPRGMNGNVGISPTRTLVDAYETVNGLTIEEDPAYDPRNPYANRDPRLDHTLFLPAFSDDVPGETLYNGLEYDPRPGSGTADEVDVDYQRSKTGFNTQKYVNPEDINDRGNNGTNFILIRYADVLLMYAEAKIEAGEIDQSVYDAINEVRQRADVDMPPIEPGKSPAELREIVRRERMVELAMEGLRFFDLRRWRIAHEVMPGPIPGMRYIRSGEDEIRTVTYGGVVRAFEEGRDYLWPIPQQERVLNPNLTQNPGY